MSVSLYYAVIRHMPDPARAEALNIGIILAGPDRFVTLRMTYDVSRVRKLDPEFDERLLHGMRHEWPQWLQHEIEQSDRDPKGFLAEMRARVGIWQTQLTEPRLVEFMGEDQDRFGFDQVCFDLFERLVKPPAPPQKAAKPPRTTIKKQLKTHFHQLKLLGEVIQEERWVEGALPLPVDFLYENGRRIAIETVEPFDETHDPKQIGEAAAATFGKWVNVKEEGREEHTLRISVLPDGEDAAIRQARRMLEPYSTVYQYPAQWTELLEELSRTLTNEQRIAAGLTTTPSGNGHH